VENLGRSANETKVAFADSLFTNEGGKVIAIRYTPKYEIQEFAGELA
jgi:hypothetical protein